MILLLYAKGEKEELIQRLDSKICSDIKGTDLRRCHVSFLSLYDSLNKHCFPFTSPRYFIFPKQQCSRTIGKKRELDKKEIL